MKRKSKAVLAATGAAVAITAFAGCQGSGAPVTKTHPGTTTAATPAAPAAATTPAPAASPDGTYSGSCDYSLGTNYDGTGYKLIGEIDETNTGNIGLVLHVRIGWPQEGYPPVYASRTVRLPYGASKAVRFHLPATENQITLLQSWQEHHGYADGCTYRSDAVDTFGSPHA